MRNDNLYQIALAGVFTAFGIVLPMMFHVLGLGSTFLPMHIPVLLSGFFLDAPVAGAVGALTPILSSVFTGMPPAFPVMPYMVFELAAYGYMTSFMYRKLRQNVYVSLVGSMVLGRIVSGIAVWVLTAFFGAKFPTPVAFIAASITNGLPGIAIQLIFIPAVVLLLKKYQMRATGRDTLEP
ncbi:MAG: ECF transporter S component [Tepidanaerobacter acetatoxydans]|uniref:ECF transporter S component n=1 Tax=Tepidanaerobacter TaxID=499228 RepID=UPI000A421EF8|nr:MULTISPECIES: ECF transporter S component [Tepidanaerobacter]NLU10962.1 ECF transporter S component [Tepidanaerobacter acetatoxydans]